MTDNVNNWANHNLTNFSDAGSWLRTDADSIGLFCKLATQYAPMVAGTEYKMTVKTNGQTWNGPGWSFQDYAGNELFQVTSDPGTSGQVETFDGPVGTEGGFRIASLGNCDVFYWDNFELVNTAADAVAIGLVFKVTGTGDTADNALAAAKTSAVAANDLFAVTGIASEEVTYIGNAVGSYAFATGNGSATSTLTQTAANRASAGLNVKGKASKEYKLTYTVAVKKAIAPAGALAVTLTTGFANESTTLPITAGGQTVYFRSAAGAATGDFVVQAVGSSVTAGVLAFSTFTLFRCCDNAKNADAVSWRKVRAFQGTATFSATALIGDDLSSDTLAEHETIEGAWSRINGTADVILAYRVPGRLTDV